MGFRIVSSLFLVQSGDGGDDGGSEDDSPRSKST